MVKYTYKIKPVNGKHIKAEARILKDGVLFSLEGYTSKINAELITKKKVDKLNK